MNFINPFGNNLPPATHGAAKSRNDALSSGELPWWLLRWRTILSLYNAGGLVKSILAEVHSGELQSIPGTNAQHDSRIVLMNMGHGAIPILSSIPAPSFPVP